MENRIETDDKVAPLELVKLMAGTGKGAEGLRQEQTLYGKYIALLSDYPTTFGYNTKEEVDAMIREADYDMHHPSLENCDLSEDERHYATLKCIAERAKKGDYVPLMLFMAERNLVAEYNGKEYPENYEQSPNPVESERLILEMGEKQFPRASSSIESISALWRKTGIAEHKPLQKEFADSLSQDNAARLTILRTMIFDASNLAEQFSLSARVNGGNIDSDLAKLMYLMVSLEHELTEEVKVDNPQMSIREKFIADEIRRGLRKE